MRACLARWCSLIVMAAVLGGPSSAQEEPPLPAGLAEPQAPDEPALPAGLAEQEEPALPAGLEAQPAEDEPPLPTGLADAPAPRAAPPDLTTRALLDQLHLTGFWEVRGGVRTQRDPHQQAASIGESRLQLQWEDAFLRDRVNAKVTADLLYDAALDRHRVNLERGDGFLDLREASIAFSPARFMDIKVGRQILTWGTGDLLFLNDLFPKDWQAFFIGRDVEYLKAPSDAIKISLFSELVNWDVVFTPRFDPDRYITGERISYYNPLIVRRAGFDFVQTPDVPNTWGRDHEWATRLSRNIRGYEFAAYGYWGYWKSPGGMDLQTLKPTFPRLSVYGGSVRGSLAGGIFNAEVAYYDSREDRQGNNRFVNNSEVRFLVGYERQMPEIASDLTLGGQYYVEWMTDYDAYRRTLLPVFPARDEVRHVLTGRVTKLLFNQNLTLGLFAYYSPSDSDAYLRPNVQYKLNDHWRAELGGNVFFGAQPHTFFNQFAQSSNVYVALRYSF